MKTVCSFILSLLIAIGIASCDSSTSPDTHEGQRIGTWMVYDTDAEWIGTQSQSKAKNFTTQAEGDTLYFDNPDGNSIRLTHREMYPKTVSFSYIDSTYSASTAPSIYIDNPIKEDGYFNVSFSEDYVSAKSAIHDIECDSSYSSNENITIEYSESEADSVFKTIIIDGSGLVEAAKILVGCQAP